MATEAVVPNLGLETEQQAPEQQESGQQQHVDTRQADKEFEQWLKSRREDGEDGKFYRRLKDTYGRDRELRRLDPKGLDGVRERYSAIDGLAHGDKTGIEAVSAMQAALSESQTLLDAVAEGNLDNLTDEHREGIIRMTPSLLETLAESNPDAYTAALLPHFVEALRESELASSFNAMVDVLKQQPPSYLTKEQMGAWMNEKFQSAAQHAGKMSQWFAAQEDRLKKLDSGDKPQGQRVSGREPAETQSPGLANAQFWKENIYPQANQYAEESFTKDLKPWQEKLAKAGFRLSKLEVNALGQQYVERVSKESLKDADYKRQMTSYNRQRSPDAASVLSLAKSQYNRRGANIMKALIEENYKDRLQAKATKPNQNQTRREASAVPDKGFKVVSVKPRREDIDFPRTPADWIYKNQWRLKNGTRVQYRP